MSSGGHLVVDEHCDFHTAIVAAAGRSCQRQECQCPLDSCHAPRGRPRPRRPRRLRPDRARAGLRAPRPARGRAAVPVLDLLARRGRSADDERLRGHPAGRPRRPAPGRHDRRPRLRRPARAAARGGAGRAARRRAPRRPRALGLHRRLRARPRRPARRPPGDDALGLGGGAGAALPAGRGRPRRALRRRGRGADLGRAQRRDRPQPARDPQGLRRRRRRAGRPPHGRGAAPRGRPGAVLQDRARRGRRLAGADPALGRRAPRRAARRRRDVPPRRGQPPHLRPPLPRGDRDDAAAVAAGPAGAGGAAAAGGVRPAGRDRGLAGRVRHRGLAARPLPPRHGDDADAPTAVRSGRDGLDRSSVAGV